MKLLSCIANRGRVIALALALSSVGSADTILFTRALPQGTNVNASTATRSDVDWINPTDSSSNYFINGDSFTVPVGQEWQVNSIAVYVVLNKPSDIPSSEFSNYALYLAPDTGDQQPQPGFQLVSTSVTPTPATFSASGACSSGGQASYLASDGVTCLPVYQMTFATNLLLGSGTYDFTADGTLAPGLTGCTGTCGWYNLATSAANAGGSTETGADGLYLDWYAGTAGAVSLADLEDGYITINSQNPAATGPCGSPTADACGGFSSPTDMNVIVTGASVPEPATVTMFSLCGLAVAIAQVRRRRSARRFRVV